MIFFSFIQSLYLSGFIVLVGGKWLKNVAENETILDLEYWKEQASYFAIELLEHDQKRNQLQGSNLISFGSFIHKHLNR